MKETKVAARPRSDKGKGAAGRMRRTGWLPAIVYGEGKASRMIQLNEHDFMMLLKGHRSEHLIVDLEVEGETPLKVLMKEMQHHPVSGRIVHVDFYEISMTKKIAVDIPIKTVGEPAGVTQQGGLMEHVARTIKVECLPTDILEEIPLDVSALKIGESLSVAQVVLDTAKYRILTDPGQPLVTVVAPKAEEEVAPAAAEGEAAAGPEVITEKKPEEGEAAGKEGKPEGKEKESKEKEGKEKEKK